MRALYFRMSIGIFCTQFICFAFHILLQSICFRMFWKMFFENTYLLSCWFHCVDILCFKFRFCETFTVTNVVARILLIEILCNFRTIKYCFTLYLHMYHVCFRLVEIEMFSISRLAFLRFTFHWYLHGSNKKYQKYARGFNQSNCRYFAF